MGNWQTVGVVTLNSISLLNGQNRIDIVSGDETWAPDIDNIELIRI